jgi:hypothetical protein
MLSSISGLSVAYLVDKFHGYLEQKPPESPLVDQSNLFLGVSSPQLAAG